MSPEDDIIGTSNRVPTIDDDDNDVSLKRNWKANGETKVSPLIVHNGLLAATHKLANGTVCKEANNCATTHTWSPLLETPAPNNCALDNIHADVTLDTVAAITAATALGAVGTAAAETVAPSGDSVTGTVGVINISNHNNNKNNNNNNYNNNNNNNNNNSNNNNNNNNNNNTSNSNNNNNQHQHHNHHNSNSKLSLPQQSTVAADVRDTTTYHIKNCNFVNSSHSSANNSDWPKKSVTLASPNLKKEMKNGWKELPQTEENGGVHKLLATPQMPSQMHSHQHQHQHHQQQHQQQQQQQHHQQEPQQHTPLQQPTAIGNNNGSLMNGKIALGNGKDHSDKLHEQDPLTGHVRRADIDEISTCGIGSCRPKWARSFASTHVFMVVFLLAWILQGMYYTYFVSVITTIEKLFQIKSKTTGLLMSATEIGQICTTLFLTYYAGRGHRPRWIACGMVLFAIASFGCTLPHFIYGDQLLHASNVFNSGSHLGGGNSFASASAMGKTNSGAHNKTTLLHEMFSENGAITNPLADSMQQLCHVSDGNRTHFGEGECEDDILIEQAAHSQIKIVVLIIFAISLLGVGVGQTAVSTLGIPYIDDNVASRESPIYIAITIGVRILGPAGGFILGSFCTRVYVDLSIEPDIGPSDPKWVGAWWLGLVLVSSLMAITSLAMFAFPRHLKGHRIPPPMKMRAIEAQKKLEKQQEDDEKSPKFKDFPKTIKRQLSNDILMFRTASSVLHLLPVAGLYTFLPKYMESQFRLPAHDANLISGIGGILVMGVGIVISGVVILKFNPTARSVAAWIAFTAIVYAFGMGILMFVGCPMDDFAGLKLSNQHPQPKFEPICNVSCDCDFEKFSPICGVDGMIYFSSCHAGCRSSTSANGTVKFYDCQCIVSDSMKNFPHNFPEAVSGYCDGNCKNFVFFISLFSFFVFMHSTSEVGSMLLIMRCTDPKDKAMAMGIIQFAIGLFGNVPCPIIYGAVVDSACLVWETICGKQGACSLYDVDMFRHFFLGTTSGIMLLAFVMDLVVWHKAHRIDIDPESSSETDYEKPTTVPESSV